MGGGKNRETAARNCSAILGTMLASRTQLFPKSIRQTQAETGIKCHKTVLKWKTRIIASGVLTLVSNGTSGTFRRIIKNGKPGWQQVVKGDAATYRIRDDIWQMIIKKRLKVSHTNTTSNNSSNSIKERYNNNKYYYIADGKKNAFEKINKKGKKTKAEWYIYFLENPWLYDYVRDDYTCGLARAWRFCLTAMEKQVVRNKRWRMKKRAKKEIEELTIDLDELRKNYTPPQEKEHVDWKQELKDGGYNSYDWLVRFALEPVRVVAARKNSFSPFGKIFNSFGIYRQRLNELADEWEVVDQECRENRRRIEEIKEEDRRYWQEQHDRDRRWEDKKREDERKARAAQEERYRQRRAAYDAQEETWDEHGAERSRIYELDKLKAFYL